MHHFCIYSATKRNVMCKCALFLLPPYLPFSYRYNSQFLMPGLVDAHNHPSQYSYTGTGYDLSIQQRLEMFKIPTEAKFADIETARTIYQKAVVCLHNTHNRARNLKGDYNKPCMPSILVSVFSSTHRLVLKTLLG